MAENKSDMHRGKRDTPLDSPHIFRVIIEGGLEAPDIETVRAFCMANISFTAGFGQMVASIRVQAGPQELPKKIYGRDGVELKID